MGKWFQRWFWRNHILVSSQEINPGWSLQVMLPAAGFGSQMLFRTSMAIECWKGGVWHRDGERDGFSPQEAKVALGIFWE